MREEKKKTFLKSLRALAISDIFSKIVRNFERLSKNAPIKFRVNTRVVTKKCSVGFWEEEEEKKLEKLAFEGKKSSKIK